MDKKTLLGILAVVIVGGGYAYQTFSGRQRGQDTAPAPMVAPAAFDPAVRANVFRKGLLVFLFGGVAFAVVIGGRHLWDKAHPALAEHRIDLLQGASSYMECPAADMTLIPDAPRRARVEGCGKSVLFRWVTPRRSATGHWALIDPNCRTNYLGFSVPCDWGSL